MKRKTVEEIILPIKEGVPLQPFVTMDDKIVKAIELMLKNNLKHIAVVHSGRPVGMVRLEHAFQKLGLKPKEKEVAL
jgi:signal-transduction protein with cAMP-binding, CBS, and nucleotidyltransferase domain